MDIRACNSANSLQARMARSCIFLLFLPHKYQVSLTPEFQIVMHSEIPHSLKWPSPNVYIDHQLNIKVQLSLFTLRQ